MSLETISNAVDTVRLAILAYMGGCQQSIQGVSFSIRTIMRYCDRALANRILLGPDDSALQTEANFGLLANDGRLRNTTEFFYPANRSQPV